METGNVAVGLRSAGTSVRISRTIDSVESGRDIPAVASLIAEYLEESVESERITPTMSDGLSSKIPAPC